VVIKANEREVMEINGTEMDLGSLKNSYDKELANLKALLLSGWSWDDMKDRGRK